MEGKPSMREKLLRQAEKEYSATQRFLALVPAGFLFLGLLPLTVYRLGALIDRRLRLPRLRLGSLSLLLGALGVVGGITYALWSIYVQFTFGRGTPIPVMATQRMIVRPPYHRTRNPMALGTIVAYAGLALLLQSLGALLVVAVASLLLLVYIKVGEEQEMVARFGAEYLAYRRRTPFLLPRKPWPEQ
jgi:protein-S-isoprenylcysteine O-methyltransferase Ste14